MHPVLHRLALLVRERVRSSMSHGLQSYPARITSPTQPTQGARQGSHTPECTSLGRQVPTLGRLREGAVDTAADEQGSGVHAAAIVVTTAFGAAAVVILWFEVFWRYCL